MNLTRRFAHKLAQSPLLNKGKHLYQQNSKNWNLSLSKLGKLQAGMYLILEDYSQGLFPPKFEDQAKTYAAEISYRTALPGLSRDSVDAEELRKPFRFGPPGEHYFNSVVRLMKLLRQINVKPPGRLLEIGCGTGWMAEFMAITGFDVTGTSIVPADIKDARRRIASVAAKGLSTTKLRFEVAPMEAVDEMVGPRDYYDAVYVFEALHHAFDWRQAIQASFDCLRPGGWLLICHEPNIMHTFISYRVAKLSNSHEIGFSRGALMSHLAKTGFSAKYMSTPFHFWVKDHWIVAQKPAKKLSMPVSMHFKAPQTTHPEQPAQNPHRPG